MLKISVIAILINGVISLIVAAVGLYIRWEFQSRQQYWRAVLRAAAGIAVLCGLLLVWINWDVNRTSDTPEEALRAAQGIGSRQSDKQSYLVIGKELAAEIVFQNDSNAEFTAVQCGETGWKRVDFDDIGMGTGMCECAMGEVLYSRSCSEVIVIVNTVQDGALGRHPRKKLKVRDSCGSEFTPQPMTRSDGGTYYQYYTVLPEWEVGYTLWVNDEEMKIFGGPSDA